MLRVLIGEGVRWYLRRAKHPFKDKIVGRFWPHLSSRFWWVRYNGNMAFKVDLQEYIQEKVFFDGEYEPGILQWIRKNLRSNDSFWDVGANVGTISLVASQLCECVLSFEPFPQTRERLSEHVEVNKCTNISIHPIALAEDDGFAEFTIGPQNNHGMNSLVHRPGAVTIQVQTARGDTLVEEKRIRVPNVVKIDVEGAELSVLKGLQGLLADNTLRAIVFESACGENHLPRDFSLVEILQSYNFTISELCCSDESVLDGVTNYLATR